MVLALSLASMKTMATRPVLAILDSSVTWKQMPTHLQNGVLTMSKSMGVTQTPWICHRVGMLQ